MDGTIVRPKDEAFLSTWKDSDHYFPKEEMQILDEGNIIYVEKFPYKTKFYAKTKGGKLKSICFPYEGKNPEKLFQCNFEQFCSELVNEIVSS